ncbi:guanine nucleotide-binding protein G(o) subunit alpha [Astyanax mexicanus]|uniref:guanine nucleotide-binding protein G(o) subunit alpha n=1 Tax=Astyanax mexicanus TaxID=7994 RepID=UPI0020CB6239|nr:guanine nucleotide-binding protein G(o) subunit alpha [Astyanax mexicanus]
MFRCFDVTSSLQDCARSLRQSLRSRVSEKEKRAMAHSAKIDQDLGERGRQEANVLKILLLGTPESGKSTLLKQMKIIYSRGFTKDELVSFTPAVLDNLLTSMKCVLHGMGVLRINLSNRKNKAHARCVLKCESCVGEDGELIPFAAFAFCSLWGDQGVRLAAAKGHEYQLNDSALYFFENMGRIIAPNYVPTEADVLRVRVRTRGIIETQFSYKNSIYRMYDVGSLRSERKKWFSYFDDARAVLFVVALNGYDLTLPERPCLIRYNVNVKSNFCQYLCSQILYMNKTDLFCEKIVNSERHLRLYCPDFRGPDCDVTAAARHVTAMFITRCTASGRLAFPHYTNATDTPAVGDVFSAVINSITQQNLQAVPLL